MRKKRLITSMLCICIAATALAGCGEKKTETVSSDDTIKVFTKLKNRPDCALVSQELSKITSEKIGTNVEFMFGYDADKITLMLASNEQMDIGFDNLDTFIDRVRQNAYVDITDMLKEKTPDLYNAIPEEFWEYTKIDGRNYAVPTYKEMGEQWSLLVDKEIIEEHNIDISQINELKDAEVILEALKQHPERSGYEILPDTTIHMNMALKEKYDTVYNEFVVDRENPDKIVHFMETQEYKDYVHLMRDWYEKGYIAKDITTRTDYESYHNTGDVGIIYTQYQPYSEIAFKDSYNADLVAIHLTPIVMSNTSMFGSLFGIYSKSKNVDKALKFLELWNTNPDVKNMITYGIEGKHYDLINGKAKIREGAFDLYKMQNAISGNMMISHILESEPDDKYEKYKEFNSKAIPAATLGFLPDMENISSKVGACANVISEYNPLLCCGAVDPDQYLDKMLKALKNSGVDEVKQELQKQYDEWRSNK